MPSSQRPRSSGPKRSNGQSEILHQVGRTVLAYSLKKLSEQKTQPEPDSRSRSSRSRSKSRHSKAREPSNSSTARRDGSTRGRDLPRSNSDEMHSMVSQLAAGVLAVGIRAIVKKRKEAKQKATANASAEKAIAKSIPGWPGRDPRPGIDPELAAALDAVTHELQGVSESISRLANTAPVSTHPDCAVREALVADAGRLNGSLANIQTSIYNMRNLRPGLSQGGQQRGGQRERVGLRRRDEYGDRRNRGLEERLRERQREENRERNWGGGRVEEGITRRKSVGPTRDDGLKSQRAERIEEERGRGDRHRRRRETGVIPSR
ncbi:uncharacterized protein C8A04DRAFT_40351 [Dichotomopilus funicola]|uniref:Uncharacterized protein n=1 Tax=Dichotomopilus funicola TaxID=1934379 RepID=A0AAN6ZJ90_9PEZI|nr:hypothetical protein C8A04DRAFT_40351 [Dichotomopilus funicola]